MGMDGDGDEMTRQNCNINGDEPKGIRKGALFSCFEVPSHQQEPLPEPIEIVVAVCRVYHRLGNVVCCFHLRVCEDIAKLVLCDSPGYFDLPLSVRRGHFRQYLVIAVFQLLGDEKNLAYRVGERILDLHYPI